MTGMAVAGLAVMGLVIWALTRTVQPAPSVATDIPATPIEQPPPATNTLPPLEGMTNPNQTTASQQPSQVPPVPDENASVKRISVTELQSKLSSKQVTVIDVRDKTTFVASHIPGSLHVPVAQIESQVTYLPKDKPIVTYCT